MTDQQFFLDQHGCAKNQVDGELLIGILQAKGWTKTDIPEDAALIIINSCGFIESAKKESLDAVITARAAYPKAKIVLAGCLSERYAEDFRGSLTEADAFFGNGDLSRFGEVIDPLFAGADSSQLVIVPEQKGVCAGDRPLILSFPRSAYVKITEGCDNCCSFCAIPLIRGSLRSRTIEAIVAECRTLVSRGMYEINLIGQDLAMFGRGAEDSGAFGGTGAFTEVDAVARAETASADPSPLSLLLRAISTIDGDFRVRLLYIHPDHFPHDILQVMTADMRFLPYFDIPFQSGDAAILSAMNRKGSTEVYKTLVQDIRSAFAAAGSPYGTVAFRSTFLVGFPGETDESFETTARFLADIRSMWSGSFTWSCEEGTNAASLKKRVTKKTAKTRLDTLLEIQIRITPEELRYFVGKTVDVLVEELIKEPAFSEADKAEAHLSPISCLAPVSRLALGRAWFQAPEVDGSVVLQYEDNQKDKGGKPIEPGSLVSAYIMAVNGVDVEAVVR